MALDLQIILYTDNQCENLYLEDATGLYSTGNTGGYNSPNMTTASVTSVEIIITILGTTLTYAFTVSSGTITAATATLSGGTPVDILADMTSAVWPFTDTNPFNLTPNHWSNTFPALEDQAYPVEYSVSGSSDYSTTDSYLVTCATCCCISKQLAKANINNNAKLVQALVPSAWLAVASYANADGDVTRANTYLTKAANICNGTEDCGCGC